MQKAIPRSKKEPWQASPQTRQYLWISKAMPSYVMDHFSYDSDQDTLQYFVPEGQTEGQICQRSWYFAVICTWGTDRGTVVTVIRILCSTFYLRDRHRYSYDSEQDTLQYFLPEGQTEGQLWQWSGYFAVLCTWGTDRGTAMTVTRILCSTLYLRDRQRDRCDSDQDNLQ